MTTQTETPAAPSTTAWHWVMTVQTANGLFNTRSAVLAVPAGSTRDKAFEYVLNQFKQEYGTPITVLFFDLQPNQL
ncbi:hypothetical protein ACFYPN_16030 [Streptomyces sp. NPDC005576]|uniref:hypothetical protein n=1 Tax=Streptomyces sp. NPDC005576 TaxID=3364726 RepID=UPI0036CD6420